MVPHICSSWFFVLYVHDYTRTEFLNPASPSGGRGGSAQLGGGAGGGPLERVGMLLRTASCGLDWRRRRWSGFADERACVADVGDGVVFLWVLAVDDSVSKAVAKACVLEGRRSGIGWWLSVSVVITLSPEPGPCGCGCGCGSACATNGEDGIDAVKAPGGVDSRRNPDGNVPSCELCVFEKRRGNWKSESNVSGGL